MARTVFLVPLLAVLALAFPNPADAAPVYGDDSCEAPFNLTLPAQLVHVQGGIALFVHDDEAGGRVVFHLRPGAASIVLQRGDESTELARADAPLPAKNAQIVLKRLQAGVAVAYDGVTVLRAHSDLPDGGRWGLLDAPATALDEIMLQPTAAIVFSDDFMRAPGQSATWEQHSGHWRVAQLESARFSANAFTLLGRAAGGGEALASAGYWFYEDLTVEASVRPSEDAEGFGVGLACQPDGDCYLLRFRRTTAPSGVLQLVRIRDGDETVLDATAAAVHANEWHRLALSGVGGQLTGTLNGAELLSAQDPTLAHGQVALWTAGREPVAFDDVEAYSGPRRADEPVILSHDAQVSDPSAQAFIDDRYMQEWADERDQWLRGADGTWHAGHYWGDVELGWEMTERGLGEGAGLAICVPAGEETLSPPPAAQRGCHLAIAPSDGKLVLTLREDNEVSAAATVAMPELPVTVALRRTGSVVEAVLDGDVVADFEAAVPAAGKIGFIGPSARRQANQLHIISRNMMDSTFRAAPTDWHIGSGEWGVSSRWDCTPRWSWFQGRSEDLASVWTRRQFDGDVVVEFFAGISMDQPWAPFYQHPGNLAVTLGGSNDTPGSGYSLVFGGWGNSAAGIFRRGELVAKVPGFTMPDILDSLGGTTGREDAHKLHNEWWRIRAERVGSTVRLLVDGELAATFDDPEPLPGGAVGIWTFGQAMTVARARVYFEEAKHATPEVREEPVAQPAVGLPLPDFGPPHHAATFEHGAAGWGPAASRACAVSVAEREAPEGGRCLHVTNPTAGGTFALAAPFAGVDLRQQPLLAFDYAILEDVAVDVFALIGGQRYRVALSGPEEAACGIEDVGRVDDARADGRWRAAQIDLMGLLSPHFPGDEPVVLERLEFAAHAAPEYMRAGIGGNPAGASWRLDNVYLGGATSAPVTVRTQRGVTVEAEGCSITRTLRLGRAEHRVAPPRSGVIAVTLTSGARSSADLIAFDLDAPTIEAQEPVGDATWLGPVLALTIADVGPAGIDERSLELRIAERAFRSGDPGVRWNAADKTLALDLRSAEVELPMGERVAVRVSAADRAGNHAEPLEFTFSADYKADDTPPDAPELTGLPEPLIDCDFETGPGPLAPWGTDAAVALRRARDPVAGNSRGGQWCLEARCTKLGGLFGVSLGSAPFEASRYPVLEFDYRAPEELRVDLIVEVDGSRRVIKFTDNDHTWRPIGRIGAVADDAWHRATIDLHALLAQEFGREAPLVVTEIAFATSGWPGNREGTRWYLDNVRLQATLDAGALPEDLALLSRDEAGLAGLAWAVDASPDTEPPAEVAPVDLPSALAEYGEDLAWVHAAAVDSAGNRSETAHIPLRVDVTDDAQPPVASTPAPTDGSNACPESISVTISDDGAGVSPADLRLTIGDRTWTVADDALEWDDAVGVLTWTLPERDSLGEDGSRMHCRLEARDLAGNAMEALEWTFTVDHALDEQPPPAPVVSYVPVRVADANDFEADTGGWGNFVAGQVLRLAEGGATGPGCVELRHLGGRGSGFVLVRDFGEGWREHPVVRFRYRARRAARARLKIFGTTFDGTKDRWTELGALPVSGDGWQTAVVDVEESLARTDPSPDIHRIFLSIDMPPDAMLLVDDYAMYSQAAHEASFRWAEPADASGVAGYSWVLDAEDDTVPPEEITGSVTEVTFTDLAPGEYCFHLRARDNAGNWGATTHIPFELKAAR